MKLEICVDSHESLLNAKNAGADRIELCSALDLDGLTPSVGLTSIAASLDIETFVMLRPRAGNFLYTDLDFEHIKTDLMILKEYDIEGFVFGALNADGSLNLDMITEVVELAYPKKVSLHRAIDYSKNGEEDLDKLADIGIVRILTSGKRETALEGIDTIKMMKEAIGDRIEIMAGSGVDASNIEEIYLKTGIRNFHMSARLPKKNEMEYYPTFGYGADDIKVASFNKVKDASDLLKELGE